MVWTQNQKKLEFPTIKWRTVLKTNKNFLPPHETLSSHPPLCPPKNLMKHCATDQHEFSFHLIEHCDPDLQEFPPTWTTTVLPPPTSRLPPNEPLCYKQTSNLPSVTPPPSTAARKSESKRMAKARNDWLNTQIVS